MHSYLLNVIFYNSPCQQVIEHSESICKHLKLVMYFCAICVFKTFLHYFSYRETLNTSVINPNCRFTQLFKLTNACILKVYTQSQNLCLHSVLFMSYCRNWHTTIGQPFCPVLLLALVPLHPKVISHSMTQVARFASSL